MGHTHFSLQQSPPLPIIAGTEGKGQLLGIIILELLFLLHLLHSLTLEDPVESTGPHTRAHITWRACQHREAGPPLRAVDSVSLGSV